MPIKGSCIFLQRSDEAGGSGRALPAENEWCCCLFVHSSGAKRFQGCDLSALRLKREAKQSLPPKYFTAQRGNTDFCWKNGPCLRFWHVLSEEMHSTEPDVSVGLGTPLHGASPHPPAVERALVTLLPLQGHLGRVRAGSLCLGSLKICVAAMGSARPCCWAGSPFPGCPGSSL